MSKSKNGGAKGARSSGSGFGETVKTAVIALAIALLIRTFLVQAFRIPSGSMEDTLLIGDFLLVDKVTYGAKVPFLDVRLPGLRAPRRGDIIVFKSPTTGQDFIKRCIGTGGDTVSVQEDQVFVNGRPLEEPYKTLKGPRPTRREQRFGVAEPLRVPQGTLFMMGDNRNNSQDSRYWGSLDPDRVVGRAFVLYWSTDPMRAPAWVRRMHEDWVKGLLQLVLGRPRITRVGTWLAHDWTDVYQRGMAAAGDRPGLPGEAAAAPAPTDTARAAATDTTGVTSGTE